ncbi:MAG: response regulator transcription factor [Deltaproteobacteria bacterium]|nr:response regulator transcription factor [Deltaproteobacteria bacterium]
MNNERILLIEDDSDISELVQYNLEREGFKVYTSADGEAGFNLARQVRPDLIILDLMLPSLDGLSVCRRLRTDSLTKDTRIVMLTAKGEESDVVVGLEMGADDYVTKPFSPRELVARIRAVLRRPSPESRGEDQPDDRLTVGPVTIDAARHEAYCHGQPLALTLAEYRLLATLISRPGIVFTREQLIEKFTGGETFVIDRNVDVHIRAIRKKLGDEAEFIMTVRGVGYKCRD